MNILVLNCGSSSVKFQLINMDDESAIAKGVVEEIGSPSSKFKYKPANKSNIIESRQITNHDEALGLVLSMLLDKEHGVITDKSEIAGIGHRVVHGGSEFASSTIVDSKVKNGIQKCIPLGPLHNPHNLKGIQVCESILTGIPQVAVFDTAFGQSLSPEAYTYALPREICEKYQIRRYGFHGTSHSYVSRKAAAHLDRPIEELRMITCHLGNGSSISAVKYGKCVETSMGFTPLEGLVMGSRCGDIDPAIVAYIGTHENMSLMQVDGMLNKRSGMIGLTGESDFRSIEEKAENGSEEHILALDVFCHRIRKYIGSYMLLLGGLDTLVFTAGIGENSSYVRRRVLKDLGAFGLTFDEEKNDTTDTDISTGRINILIIPTNEELAIARDTQSLLERKMAFAS